MNDIVHCDRRNELRMYIMSMVWINFIRNRMKYVGTGSKKILIRIPYKIYVLILYSYYGGSIIYIPSMKVGWMEGTPYASVLGHGSSGFSKHEQEDRAPLKKCLWAYSWNGDKQKIKEEKKFRSRKPESKRSKWLLPESHRINQFVSKKMNRTKEILFLILNSKYSIEKAR